MKSIFSMLLCIFFCTLTLAQESNGLWSLLMTKIENNGIQRWKTRTSFPEQEIKNDWNDNYTITQLSYLNGLWTLVTAKNNLYEQSWRTRNTIESAMATINEMYVLEKKITSVDFGKGQWAIVASKGTNYTFQEAQKHYLDFPFEYIQLKRSEGYYVSDIGFDGTYWITIMSRDPKTTDQVYLSKAEFPENEIKNYWDKGYRINKLKYLGNKWYVFFIKNPDYGMQAWRTRYEFPEKEINELWADGYSIAGISFNPNYKAPVTAPKEETLVGVWNEVGTSSLIEFQADGYYIVEYWDYDDFTGVDYKVRVGGKGYKDEFGTPINITYEVNNYSNPKRLDIVGSNSDGNETRVKCIYKFEGGKLIIKIPNDGVTMPASNFNAETGYEITTLERAQ